MSLDALSPTIITGWLECEHSLTLRMRRSSAPQAFGPFADLVRDKGMVHELAVRRRFVEQGLAVLDVPGKDDSSFLEWAERSTTLLVSTSADVIYQMPLVHEGIKGVADFLIRVDAEPGFSPWEPVDAKLARGDGKPGHLLQLCFYADAVAQLTGAPPKHMHLELGSGTCETYRFEEFGPYWRRMKLELSRTMAESAPARATEPEPCGFCQFCDFQKVCEQQWRDEDSLVFVANLAKADRTALIEGGVTTLEQLATTSGSESLPRERYERVAQQAVLQQQRRDHPDDAVPFTSVAPADDPIWGHGYSHLPPSDEGDVFFDLEGHPLFTAEAGIFFLFGLLYRENGAWTYKAIWAHSLDEQQRQAAAVVRFFEERRQQFPNFHVFHYNHTERSSLHTMTADTEASVAFAHLSATGMFVDLLIVVKNSFQIGIESYGLKDMEAVTGFHRTGELHAGSGAVLLYEEFIQNETPSLLDEIALYNENDVRSTLALREWLLANRPSSASWRAVEFDEFETYKELDELSYRLLQFDAETTEHLLGNLIGYWRRERSAQFTPLRERVRLPVADLVDDPDVVTGLTILERDDPSVNEETGAISEKATFAFPDQELDAAWTKGKAFIAGSDGATNFGYVSAIDLEERTATISWKHSEDESELAPISVIADDWVGPMGKQDALLEAARNVLRDPQTLPPVTRDLLRRAKPRFEDGGGPPGGLFGDSLAEMISWAPQLDSGVVAVQGPPGTGKTYRGARMVRALLQAGKRVGVTGPSYSAFGNFMEAVAKLYVEEGDIDSLSACQRIKDSTASKPFVGQIDYATDNKKAANAKYQLTAGTSWFFCGKDMMANPVDYLIVDEAGQMSLADVAAMSLFATNVILLGDPLQLDQVSNALHPEGSGMSSLEYMLAGDRTIASDRGVFITETWRMHPEICHFISSQIYEDRLHSHPSCERQTVAGHGSGLRWMEATHTENSSESTEEAEMIAAKILDLLGAAWTDQDGNSRPLDTDDFMVVAPFNDQKDEIRRFLALDPRTAPIAPSVGTVDKFQGREAPVVFFSMTTSDADGLHRGADFLFSRSRLNVAISRARGLAYLVCTDALLGTKAATVESMRLIGTLNSFVEAAEPVGSERP